MLNVYIKINTLILFTNFVFIESFHNFSQETKTFVLHTENPRKQNFLDTTYLRDTNSLRICIFSALD